MSLGGEIMNEHYDNLIQEFLVKLEKMEERAGYYYTTEGVFWHVIEEYKEHFRNNGIYGG